jgi:uncharacterized protein (TIGR03083 family)
MSPSEGATDTTLRAAVETEYLALADQLEALTDAAWDTPSLCEGWRVREVVAHMTMPARYSAEQFMAELRECEGDFTRLSNRVASRDAELPTSTLVANLRDDTLHEWTPGVGGRSGALNHAVIHGLDVTVPLGLKRGAPQESVRFVVDALTVGGAHEYFGFDIAGRELQATDMDWRFGSGKPVRGSAADLALLICGRILPPGRIQGQL